MISITDSLKSEELKKKLHRFGDVSNNPKEDYLDIRAGANRVAGIMSLSEIWDADVGAYVN